MSLTGAWGLSPPDCYKQVAPPEPDIQLSEFMYTLKFKVGVQVRVRQTVWPAEGSRWPPPGRLTTYRTFNCNLIYDE